MNKLKVIDLFAGCGGLSLGFRKAGFKVPIHLEINENFCKTLEENALPEEIVINEDITKYENYLNNVILKNPTKINGIIGGPPCQAYSIAGRNKEENNMSEDPRNFLFESFNFLLKNIQPDFFIFENVLGMLSAKPYGIDLISELTKSFNESGYAINTNLKDCVFDMSEYGVPQKRKRVIIFGVNKSLYSNTKNKIDSFYREMRKNKKQIKTVKDAIGDLPKIKPIKSINRISHKVESSFSEHEPRFHNERDIKIFQILAEDIESGRNEFKSIESLKKIYEKYTAKSSSVHKYNVLNWDKPSNTIPAHLHKDGLRHIHPDPTQGRSITVREAARLMTFPDDYVFKGSRTDKFKMLGNAVPPDFSIILGEVIKKVLY